MNPTYWNQIAKDIADRYDEFDGFVMLHGTDTMAYTASALGFMLRNLRKPVVITGSQLPIGDTREDGTENLISSLEVAAAKDENGDPMIQEVVISFLDYIVRGVRSTKFTSTGFHDFKSFNYPNLGTIDLHIDYNKPYLMRHSEQLHSEQLPLDSFYQMDPSVLVIWLYPGITEDIVKAGVITGYDITVEAAVTKMMYLLGSGLSTDQIKQYLTTDLVGELTAD